MEVFVMEEINFKRWPNLTEKQLLEIKNKSKSKNKYAKVKKEKIVKKKLVRISGFVSNGYICEMVINKNNRHGCFALYHHSTNHLTYEDRIEQENRIYIPAAGDGLIIGNMIKIPRSAQKYGSIFRLMEDLRKYLNKYVYIQDELDREIVITYILLTWVYDRFSAIPYLRILGDYGTGKSRLLKVMSVCYRSLYTSGMASAAPIFRLIHGYGCTLIIDEAEFSNKLDRNEDIKEILRFGKDSDGVVLRCDPNTLEVKGFKVFGPKILGSRRPTGDDALESRVISIRMQQTKSKDIPLFLDEKEFGEDSQDIRSKLLMYRFENYFKIDPLAYRDIIDYKVFSRINEMFAPLICIRKDDGEFTEKIVALSMERHEEILEDKSMSLDAEILKAIHLHHLKSKNGDPLVQKITEEVNCTTNKGYASRSIGSIIRNNFKLKTRHTKEGNVVLYEEGKFLKLVKEYNLTEMGSIKSENEIEERLRNIIKKGKEKRLCR
jgi:hypothetical protein